MTVFADGRPRKSWAVFLRRRRNTLGPEVALTDPGLPRRVQAPSILGALALAVAIWHDDYEIVGVLLDCDNDTATTYKATDKPKQPA